MILPILIFAAVLLLLGLLAILLAALVIGGIGGSLVGGILAGTQAANGHKMADEGRIGWVMFGTLAGGFVGGTGLVAFVMALLYLAAA